MKGVIVHNKNNPRAVIMITNKYIYTSMAQIYGNDESSSRHFVDILQLINWILDPGTTCHMKPQVSDLSQVCYMIQINILKLPIDITSQ